MKGLLEYIQQGLKKFSAGQRKYFISFLLILIVLTLVMSSGLFKLKFESDFSKFEPENAPITKLTRDISKDFGSLGNVVVAVYLDENSQGQARLNDIRDPEVIKFLQRLQINLQEISSVQEVNSLANFFPYEVPDAETVRLTLDNIPFSSNLVSADYGTTLVIVNADLGEDSKKIKDFSEEVSLIIAQSAPPAGVVTVTTGEAPLGATIFNLMVSDAIKTSIIAVVFIFVLLLIIQRSLKDSVLVMIPLLVGISWTFSLLGLLEIPINIGTAGISAMLIGLGVEYNIFLIERYKEEKEKNGAEEGLKEAIANIGGAIFSSGGTTALGFMALATSIFPILAGLGSTLAIGIIMLLLSTVIVTPIVIIAFERFWKDKPGKIKVSYEKPFRAYSKFLTQHPKLFLVLGILITAFMIFNSGHLNNQDMSFENMMSEDQPVLKAFLKVQNEFGDATSAEIMIALDPVQGTKQDVRDPEIIHYIDLLTQKAKLIQGVTSISSISEIARKKHDGHLPQLLTADDYTDTEGELLSADYAITLIKISLTANADGPETVRQIQEIIDNTTRPAGLQVEAIGGLAAEVEQNNLFGPDSNKTSMLALIAIIAFLLILSRSIKNTILPLVTVIFGVLWTIGMIGLFQIPFNNVTSSVITMIIGIGIDFGIQIITRFDYERKEVDKVKAMENTLASVLPPMLITVIAAVVGFRAMVFGELNLMGDLGVTMSLAIVACMLAAVKGVAALILLVTRKSARI